MSARSVSPHGLRCALMAGIQRVIAHREEIDRINVFPLADGDTGTNLALTLGAVVPAVSELRCADAREILARAATEALDSSRGDSGAIIAHFLEGVAGAIEPGTRLTPGVLSRAFAGGAAQARTAIEEPTEGTLLTVMQAFAAAWQAKAGEEPVDVRTCFLGALEAAREALRRTTGQLQELRAARVVDAGGLGFVELLEGMADFIARGRGALGGTVPEEFSTAGVESWQGGADTAGHRYGIDCVVSAGVVDRRGLEAALVALPVSRLVLTGTRSRVRLHARAAETARVLAAAARFGELSRITSEDLLAPSAAAAVRRRRVAIVTDSAADLPAEELDRLSIHVVPQRLSIGGRDMVDGVSISARDFFQGMRTSPVPPRTSQPPPGDFRRMFEYLLARHERVLDVAVGSALSGTMQSAVRTAARVDASRIAVFDSSMVSVGQGLLALWAAEAAQAGWDVARIQEGLERMRPRTSLYAVVRDLTYGARGGRAPRLAVPLTRLLRFSLLARNRADGKLGMLGGLWGRNLLPERFARRVARRLEPGRRYRLLVGHCDCAADAARVEAALRANVRQVESLWVVETGVVIGAHAGPGTLVIGVQDYEAPGP